MTDTSLRRAERDLAAGDAGPEAQARVLAAKLRAGLLSEPAVRLAAELGHEGARLVVSDEPLVAWEAWAARRDVIGAMADLRAPIGSREWRQVVVSFACDCAERVLPRFEARWPDDSRPAKALELARRWARGEGVPESALLAACTYDACTYAAYSSLTSHCTYAAYSSLTSHASYPTYSAHAARSAAAQAARAAAARSAVEAAGAAAHATAAACSARFAAHAAARLALDADSSERDWQRARLAAYALSWEA